MGIIHNHKGFEAAKTGVTCSPKSDPVVMRVSAPRMGQEILDEAEATQSRADYHEAA